MTLNDYQTAARSTAIYPKEYRVVYPALKLAGEAGEVAEKVGKALRDANGQFGQPRVDALGKELGDVLWYIAALAYDLGLSLESIAEGNLSKLADRASRGVLGGSGDNR
jgi:NTP pyrophosphatase (non-canonical NTP hydrolase)